MECRRALRRTGHGSVDDEIGSRCRAGVFIDPVAMPAPRVHKTTTRWPSLWITVVRPRPLHTCARNPRACTREIRLLWPEVRKATINRVACGKVGHRPSSTFFRVSKIAAEPSIRSKLAHTHSRNTRNNRRYYGTFVNGRSVSGLIKKFVDERRGA